jgi:CDGSH-type Zn-finger protein/uncharacterized Fe-S cluster protein YjdI
MADEPTGSKSGVHLTVYYGEKVDITMDRRLCMYAGECNRAKGGLFVRGRDPWCVPDQLSPDDAAEVVRRCPSGALSYRRKDGGPQEAPLPANTILVSNNGPLYVRGDLEVEGAKPDMPGTRCRAALCRCGRTKRKPFCDDSHEDPLFDDGGAVGEKGTGYEGEGGKLTIKSLPCGPLCITGKHTILSGSGRAAWKGTYSSLCRCGHSKGKPFCDGSHEDEGWQE